MTKLIIGLLTVAGIVTARVMAWYWSDEQKAKREAKRRYEAHQANAAKDGKKLGQWFRKAWRK